MPSLAGTGPLSCLPFPLTIYVLSYCIQALWNPAARTSSTDQILMGPSTPPTMNKIRGHPEFPLSLNMAQRLPLLSRALTHQRVPVPSNCKAAPAMSWDHPLMWALLRPGLRPPAGLSGHVTESKLPLLAAQPVSEHKTWIWREMYWKDI